MTRNEFKTIKEILENLDVESVEQSVVDAIDELISQMDYALADHNASEFEINVGATD